MTSTMSAGAQLNALAKNLGIEPRELQAALAVDHRTYARWIRGATFPQHQSRSRIAALERLAERLERTFDDSEGVKEWLHAPSGYFGSLRPLDALQQGRIDAVNAALDALEAGVFV